MAAAKIAETGSGSGPKAAVYPYSRVTRSSAYVEIARHALQRLLPLKCKTPHFQCPNSTRMPFPRFVALLCDNNPPMLHRDGLHTLSIIVCRAWTVGCWH